MTHKCKVRNEPSTDPHVPDCSVDRYATEMIAYHLLVVIVFKQPSYAPSAFSSSVTAIPKVLLKLLHINLNKFNKFNTENVQHALTKQDGMVLNQVWKEEELLHPQPVANLRVHT